MSFTDYLKHYFSMPSFLWFFLISLLVVFLIHMLLLLRARRQARSAEGMNRGLAMYRIFQGETEQYYELVFSSTSTLLFTGIYFLIDFDRIHLSESALRIWEQYKDFLLLGLIVLSIILINLMDHLIIPLQRLDKSKIGTLRMAGMLYMLAIFAYIKIIYEDDNYDIMIFYFLTMLVGRFVYLDASLEDFRKAVKNLLGVLPILALVLLSTALLALYGFESGYLLTSNGVVFSLFLAHCFVILEIFFLSLTGLPGRTARRLCVRIYQN